MRPQLASAEIAALNVAEAWVREPEEDLRRAAPDLGIGGDGGLPAVWMALAAGWSGGSLAPPEQTARAIRAGLLIAMTRISSEDARKTVEPCFERGIEFVLARAT